MSNIVLNPSKSAGSIKLSGSASSAEHKLGPSVSVGSLLTDFVFTHGDILVTFADDPIETFAGDQLETF